MSINYIEIITKQDYKEYAPADNYTEAQITTAINMSFDLLDDYSGYLISQKWELTSENGGFTDKQKYLIKKAFLIQTRYYLQCGLRRPQGQIQRTNGSTGININTPNRDELQKEAMRCLEAAGLTKTIWSKSALDCCDECIDVSKLLTINLARQMCLLTQYTPIEGAEHKKNKIVMYNNNCEAEWVDPSIIGGPSVYLKNVEFTDDNDGTTRITFTKQDNTVIYRNLSRVVPTILGIVDYDGIQLVPDQNSVVKLPDFVGRTEYSSFVNAFVTFTENTANRFTNVNNELSTKQNKTDNNLQTTDKTIIGAINEVNTRITNSVTDIYNDMEGYVNDVVWGQPDGSTQLTLCIKYGNGENHQILQNALIYRHYFKCFVKIDRSYVCCAFTIDTNSPSKMNYQQVERWFFRSPFTQISGAAPNNLTNLYPVSGISSTVQVNTPNGTNYVGNVAVGIYAYIHTEDPFVLCDLYLAVNYGGYTMIDKSDAVVVNFATQNLITGEWVTYE